MCLESQWNACSRSSRKNEVINISTDVPAFSERVDVPLSKPLTLNELLSKTKEYMGKDFFPYSWADNNCQVFINSILQANGLWSPELHKWLFQPLGELVAKLPEASRWTAKALTDVAAWFNKMTGKGYDVETLKEMRKNIDEYLYR